VEAHIARIVQVNGKLNAVVKDRFDAAREEARLADMAVERGEPLGPFHGVPCTIKESIALTGMPNTGGHPARKGLVAARDAVTVARLRKAGAIPLGVTNLSELTMWMESNNGVYGRTSNAYDHRRTSGGSSGGEGAVVGAGGAPFGLGADIGGSIRMPAFFNGVFGHKPTGGLIPNSGQFPISTGDALLYMTTGPLARRAEDLWPLVETLAGPHPGDDEDTRCRAHDLGDPAKVDVGGITVLDVAGNGAIRVEPALAEAQRAAARALAARGATVRKTRVEGLKHSLEIWAAMLGEAEATSFRAMMGAGREFFPGRELLRWALRRSDHTLPAIALAAVENVTKLAPARTKKMIALGRKLREEIAELIGDGVMLYPSYPVVAPRHNAPLFPPIKWMYTAVMNVLELPVTQVPLGLDKRGLPLGVQVVGAHGNDHVTVAVAVELEKIFGGWVPPPGEKKRRRGKDE
jgi:fatty acid amide hydrolase 2